ncbi:MAG: hypothetical protein HY269_10590, partial [Deltaproteobacteria bacterium]|nr:hypothetical protein [Deltaproteobacteria bacterium]
RTEAADGKVRTIPDSGQPVRAPMTISSIGSIPEPIPGIPQRGEVYQYVDANVGLLMEGTTGIYAAGNVLTGKGNIKDSLVSGTEIGIHVAERYLGLLDDATGESFTDEKREEAHVEGLAMAASIDARELVPSAKVAEIMARVRKRQSEVGYESDYRGWIKKITPADLQ